MIDTATAPITRRADAAPLKQRRPRWLLYVGVLIIALGVLLGSFLFRAGQSTKSVVVVRSPLTAGERITATQLATATLPANSTLKTIDGDSLKSMVGRYATMALPDGALLTPDAAVVTLTPPAGRSIVGIGVKAAQAPTKGLASGQPVRIVITNGAGSNSGTDKNGGVGTEWRGTLVSLGAPSNTGVTTIDIEVASSDAGQVVAAAGAGNVAVVLDSRG